MKTGKTVLVVDDDESVRNVLRHSLESSGHEVICCEDGEAALLLARERSFDVVVTDYRMSGINGAIVVGTIRALHPRTVVIGISGSDDGGNMLAAGAHVFLKKPIDFDRLDTVLRGDRTL